MHAMPRAGVLLLSLLLLASCGGEEGPRPIGVEGAHEHGVARVNLAIEGAEATLEFTSPAAEIYGFERAPRTPEEEAQRAEGLEKVATRLDEAIRFAPALACEFAALEVGTEAGDHDHDHDHGHDDHGQDDHAHDHDHGHGVDDSDHRHEGDHGHESDQDQTHDPDHAHEGDHAHADVSATFRIRCSDTLEGSTLRLHFDALFPGIVDLDLQVIGDRTFGGRYRATGGTRIEL